MFLLKESENKAKNNVPHVDKGGLEPPISIIYEQTPDLRAALHLFSEA